ncbi:MAG: hypothetical protein HQ500_03975 [Flavobacteriales bacterium]|nr:hypothetical protein [Flavobacteriales bacterium]
MLLLLLSATSISALSQSSNEEGAGSPDFYTNVNAGFGLLYGGFGGNLEGGIGHFAGFGALGYATKRTYDTVTINPSVNYHFGLRYYLNVGSEVLFPRIGIGYGWIANYYSPSIGNRSYDQNVKGLSLHLGAQFYTVEGLVFNFDVAMSSKLVISNVNDHPSFFPFYLRPCIGIGYDLTKLVNDDDGSGRIRNKEIDPFGN